MCGHVPWKKSRLRVEGLTSRETPTDSRFCAPASSILGRKTCCAMKLYVALTVFPDSHAFGDSDAAVLLGGGEIPTKPISILERWVGCS